MSADIAADPAIGAASIAFPRHEQTFPSLNAKQYAGPGHMKASMEVFRAFPQDATDFAELAKTKLPMPMLVLSGEKAGGPFLIEQGKMVATNVEGVLVPGRGHWLMEEAPDQVIPKLVEFLDR